MAQNNSTIEGHETPALRAGQMAIDIEQYGDVCVLRCRGCLLAGLDADYVQAKIGDIQQLKCTKVVADLREVPSIGSTGLAFIVGVYSVVKNSGGRLVVASATPLVQRVLDLTKLSTLIPSVADLGSGLAALRAGTS